MQQALDAMDVLDGKLTEFLDEAGILLALRSELDKRLDVLKSGKYFGDEEEQK